MKLNEFISNLLDIVNEKPELGNLEVIYQQDVIYTHYRVENKPRLVKVEDFTVHCLDVDTEITTNDIPNAIIIN